MQESILATANDVASLRAHAELCAAHGKNEPVDVSAIRAQFPALKQQVHGHVLVYLDNAATTQKPQRVLDALHDAYVSCSGNVHRGVHTLSGRATTRYEAVRIKVQKFLHALSPKEVIFTHGATESINLVAHSYAANQLKKGDEIVVTCLEHHANIVPWQQVVKKTGATLRVAPIDDNGNIDMAAYEALLNERTKLVAISHVSNAIGTVLPVATMVKLAKKYEAVVLVDGAQAVAHGPIDVLALGCDFYVFSGHKLFGPSGVGVLWGHEALLDTMPPFLTGGSMINEVSFENTTFADVPARFEAGTPAVSEVIGLGEALDFIATLDWDMVRRHEANLLAHAIESLQRLPGLTLVGKPHQRAGVIAFVLDYAHPHDIGTVLDMRGIAVRSGHHCAQPLMQRFGLPSTARASFTVYNTHADVDALVAGLEVVRRTFAPS